MVALFVARYLTATTLSPVKRLSNVLQTEDVDDQVIELANEFTGDEIGILARELAAALKRVRDSADREYEFNRGVSHELRSLIQVAQSATELLTLYSEETPSALNKPIFRLQRSIKEMNEIAEAFLWLSSDRILQKNEMCSVATIQDTLSSLKTDFPDSELALECDHPDQTQYPIPAAIFSIILRNLIRNAVIHGEPSLINIDVQSKLISISNASRSQALEGSGFGIGLSIVHRICDRFGCQLITKQLDDDRYSASIQFP